MAAPVACSVEVDTILNVFSTIKEIESIFLLNRNHAFLITIIIPAKDYGVENRIYDSELELMDRFENCLFDFNIVARSGKKVTDIVTPSGQLIFERAA